MEAVSNLRVAARKNKVYLRVVKNTLARRALQDTAFSGLGDDLKGALMLAFATEEPGSAARVIKEFVKTNEKLTVKLVALQGRKLSPSDLDAVATLPTREQALSTLMATIKAPVQKFVRTLAEPHAKLVRTFAAVRDQKQSQSAG